MNKLYILGNGSFAQEVFEQIIVANQINNFGGFIILKDDKAFCIGEEGAEGMAAFREKRKPKWVNPE